tara:strand:+ start:232 stop:681 length:450 start_codon:yes stop_codon:yes gene_type:complete
MPRGNKKGGKKHKRGKKAYSESKALRMKEDGQEYAQITACKGNCRFGVMCFDGKERMAIMCGAMKKRNFVNMNDVVLVSLRDFQDNKCDIIDKYDENQVRKLKEEGHVPNSINLDEENEYFNGDDGIEFVSELPPDEDSGSDGIDLDEI